MKILHRFTELTLFECDAETVKDCLMAAAAAKANLSGANLSGANLPVIEGLSAKILDQVQNGGSLEMSAWHTCGTTHCVAGWAITLAGETGADLERQFGPNAAGALIFAASEPNLPVPNFYAYNSEALEDLKNRASEVKSV